MTNQFQMNCYRDMQRCGTVVSINHDGTMWLSHDKIAGRAPDVPPRETLEVLLDGGYIKNKTMNEFGKVHWFIQTKPALDSI